MSTSKRNFPKNLDNAAASGAVSERLGPVVNRRLGDTGLLGAIEVQAESTQQPTIDLVAEKGRIRRWQ
jgi:hypothetical protein